MRASVKNNTNRVVSTSDENWSSVRNGTLMRFEDDDIFYQIGNVRNIFLVKEYTKVNDNTIKINSDVDIDLIENDCITLSYKEYELLTVINPINKGTGYKISDIVYLEGGIPCVDLITKEIMSAKLVVSSVSDKGEILQLKLENAGRYTVCPNVECSLVGGSGSGALMQVDYTVLDNRVLLEKTISRVDKNLTSCNLILDSALPNGVTKGKISVKKWEILLSNNYVGDTKINSKFDFLRDFSPNLKIPFIAKGNASPETIYNLAISILDQKIGKLEKELNDLKYKNR